MSSHITTKEHARMMAVHEKEIERLRQQVAKLEEDRKVMIQSLETQGDRIAELEAEVERLAKCCTQRGARMQKIYYVLRCCMKRETISIPEWNELVGWFDADGVPK